MNERIEIPTFTYGTYRSLTGEEVTFTDELMRQLEANTKAAIKAGALTPPVGYDEFDATTGKYTHRGTEAHGHITDVTYRNGVVHLAMEKPSEKFRSDVREGRRLRVSGEFVPKFWYTAPDGKAVELGPTIVGLAALGRHRPALKNPKIVPLSQLPFAETIPAAEVTAAREELRKSRVVAHTFADDKFAFSEIDIDPRAFADEENDMDKSEIQALIAAAVDPIKAENALLKQTVETQKREFGEQIASLSENSQRAAEVQQFCENLNDAKNKRLTKIMLGHVHDVLMHPSVVKDKDLDRKIRASYENIPAFAVQIGQSQFSEGDGGDEDEGKAEPKALRVLKVKHFADVDANQGVIDAGLSAFAEFKPDLKLTEKPLPAQVAALEQYVTRRDNGHASN